MSALAVTVGSLHQAADAAALTVAAHCFVCLVWHAALPVAASDCAGYGLESKAVLTTLEQRPNLVLS